MPDTFKNLITILFFSLSSTLAFGQTENAKIIDWKLLAQVDFEDRYHEEYEAWYLYPKFSPKIEALDGKQVAIKGYVIPLDVEGGLFALSAYPFSACFFCGGAGPESVISLKFEEAPPRYDTDDVATFTGRLELNSTDVENFNYILHDSQELE